MLKLLKGRQLRGSRQISTSSWDSPNLASPACHHRTHSANVLTTAVVVEHGDVVVVVLSKQLKYCSKAVMYMYVTSHNGTVLYY